MRARLVSMIASGLALLAVPAAPPRVAAQPAVVLGTEEARATVETVDQQRRMVLLRGPTSINASGRSQQPLYIVDGLFVNGGIQDINPNDIESVEILKGAAASNLYGERAGSGVIAITTKSGKNSQTGVRFGRLPS